MSKYYRLCGHTPVPCSLMEWAQWHEKAENRICCQKQIGDAKVSTVFLGLNHQFGDGPPLLFETMIFGGPHDGYQERCSTWDEALKQHLTAERLARGTVS